MTNYGSYEGKLIRMMEAQPIYDREDDDKIIGYTTVGDRAVIVHHYEEDYFEVTIVTGSFAGVDTLALNKEDIEKSVFLFNKIDENGSVSIRDKVVKYEYL